MNFDGKFLLFFPVVLCLEVSRLRIYVIMDKSLVILKIFNLRVYDK